MNQDVDPEINLSDLFKKLGFGNGNRANTGKGNNYIIPIILVVVLVIWFATGVYQVGPRENGVVSIVEAQMVIQYKVSDPKAFIFSAKDPENVLRGASEVSLRSIMGRTKLDDALTSRAIVEQETYTFLLSLLSTYNIGIDITEIKLQVVDPPEEVKDAFQDVTRALEEETTLKNNAKQYAAKKIPTAKGQVQVKIREAAAFHQRQIENATGDTARFLALLEEYRKDPIVTRDRIYIEKMESVFAGVNKTIIDTKVQVLPLLDFAKSSENFLNDSVEVTNE